MTMLTVNNLKSILKENNDVLMKEVKSDIKSAIKENNDVLMKEVRKEIRNTSKVSELSIKKYIGGYVGDAVDRVLNTIEKIFGERDLMLKIHSNKIDDLTQDVKFMHQDLKDIVADMSDKPSRKQFEEFKSSFRKYSTI